MNQSPDSESRPDGGTSKESVELPNSPTADQRVPVQLAPPPTNDQEDLPSGWHVLTKPIPKTPKYSIGAGLPPAPSFLVLGLAALSAYGTDLTFHSSGTSVVAWLAIVSCGLMILASQHRSGRITPSSVTTVVLAIIVGFNLVLRDALVVAVPSWIAALFLLFTAAHDVSFQPVLKQITQPFMYMIHVFQTPLWLTKRLDDVSVSQPKIKQASRAIVGLGLALAVTIPVIALLASGDEVFASLFSVSNPDLSGTIGHLILTGIIFLILMPLSLSASKKQDRSDQSSNQKPARSFPIELLIVFGALILVLGVWCVVQVVVALDGATVVLETADLTRAEYAREGFFQLVAVAGIIASVLAVSIHFFRRTTRSGMTAARIGAGLLTAETLALCGVAFVRLDLYIQAFGLTATRLFVAWFLAWLSLTLTILAARALLTGRSAIAVPRVVPAIRAVAAIVLLMYGWSNPDAQVATANLTRSSQVVELDESYLLRLSDDAFPVIAQHQDRFSDSNGARRSNFEWDCYEIQQSTDRYGPLGWNLGRARARSAAEGLACD